MLRAVTNRDFPMLRESLKSLFGMELQKFPSFCRNDLSITRYWKRRRTIRIFRHIHFFKKSEPYIRILFVNAEDLSFGMAKEVDVTGRSIPFLRLILIGIPKKNVRLSGSCRKSSTIEGYLLAVTFHELYELLTGDFEHCNNPNSCINSLCNVYDVGTCSACMGALIDEKIFNLTLEDLYCPEHLGKLKLALKKWD